MKKILVLKIESQYNVLEVFQQEIIEGFEAEGYLVEADTAHHVLSRNDLMYLSFSQYEFVFCINLILLERLAPYFPAATTVVSLVVDHPIYHVQRFRNLSLNLICLHVDVYRMDFASKYFPFVRKHCFLPHGGSARGEGKPFERREYGIVHMGSYELPDEFMEALIRKRGNVKDFSLKVIEIYLQQETISISEAVRQACEVFHIEPTEEQISFYLNEFYLEDKYIRACMRDLSVRVLLQAGMEVHVFGNGWEDFKGENTDKLHIHGPVPYEEALGIMGNTKIFLNVAPTLNNGSHERIFSAMLNGAMCFTTRSLYLEREGLDQEVIEFSFNTIGELPQMVQLILDNPGKAEVLTKHAKKIAEEKHQWKNRVNDILEIVKQCREEWGYEKKNYNNSCETEFGEWCDYIKSVSESYLFDGMKRALFLHEGDTSNYLESALSAYNYYGFWGNCEPEKENYELFHNRVSDIKEHYEDIVWIFGELQDYRSKCVLNSILRYWIDYSPLHLEKIMCEPYDQYFDLDLICCDENEVFVDVGVCKGETVRNYVKNYGNYKRIICYEMLEENMNACRETLSTYRDIDCRQRAVGDDEGMVTLDEDVKEKITFLKMDIEGGEYAALEGAKNHIKNDHPKLAIACYHGNQDFWRLARLIKGMEKEYRFYLRYYGGCVYPSECVLYGICPQKG